MTSPKRFGGFFEFKVRLSGIVIMGGTLVSLATILGFLGPFWWFFDLFSHFRVQYFLLLAAAAVFLLVRRRLRPAVLFGALAVVNLPAFVPLYFGGAKSASSEGRMRAVLFNINTSLGKPAGVIKFLNESKADIIVLEEINHRWVTELREIIDRYPNKLIIPREDNFGIMLLSERPFLRCEPMYFGYADVPSIVAEIDDHGSSFLLIATHPLPPSGPEYSRERNDQLAAIAEYVREAKQPVLLLEDLNAAPWNHYLKALRQRSGLLDSSQGRGVQPTWPTQNPVFLVPLDHCLHSPGISILDKRLGPRTGSDHFPVIVDFRLERGSAGRLSAEVRTSPP